MVGYISTELGFDNYWLLFLFSLLDLSGKLTRFMFAGRVLTCGRYGPKGKTLDDRFAESFQGTIVSFLQPFIQLVGFGGLAVTAIGVGVILLQGGRALRSFLVIRKVVREAKERD